MPFSPKSIRRSRFFGQCTMQDMMRIRQNNVEKIVSHAGFYLLQCPAAYAMLATPGFPAVHEAQLLKPLVN